MLGLIKLATDRNICPSVGSNSQPQSLASTRRVENRDTAHKECTRMSISTCYLGMCVSLTQFKSYIIVEYVVAFSVA